MLWGEKDPWEKMEDGRKLYEIRERWVYGFERCRTLPDGRKSSAGEPVDERVYRGIYNYDEVKAKEQYAN